MDHSISPGTMTSGVSRRQFLRGCAACAAALPAVSALAATGTGAGKARVRASSEKAKVRLVFSHVPPEEPTWPNIGYDYDGRKRELTARLRRACPDIEFLPATATDEEEAQKILRHDDEVDGYMLYLLGIWSDVPETIVDAGRPTILVDELYAGSGEFLIQYARAMRKGLKVAGVSSSDFDDVVQAARCFSCLKKLQSSTIVAVGGGWGSAEAIEEVFGTRVQEVSFEELNQAYEQADEAKARRQARRWIRRADKVIEPSREEIGRSARMYQALQCVMDKYEAHAITVDCLSGFYGGHMTAYPCLGFHQLNNDGYVGACEGDLLSTSTMLIMSYLVNRPGFISDPVIDTSKNQIIYAHCVAPSRVFGPDGPTNPYHIRSHAEDRKGASIRSLMPLGEMTTTLLFKPEERKVIMHQGVTVENVDEDKACRTKLAAEVKGDIDKLLTYWDQWGWHRVTYYGDYRRTAKHFAALAGFEVVEEA